MITPARIVVSVDDQLLRVFRGDSCIREFPVSTALRGVGFAEGSLCTPTGNFRVCEKIGHGAPSGTIFKSRISVGIWNPAMMTDDDLILSRILRLEGMDHANENTFARYIYIHGTHREDLLGQAASHGCVRLANADMIELFDLVSVGGEVVIFSCDNPNRSYNKGHMSSKQKKSAATGIRYTDSQKKEVVDFVVQYNKTHGRGGQSTASKKFKVNPLTVTAWIKVAGKTKLASPVKKVAPAKTKKSANSKMGVRYSPEKKQEVVSFVTSYNAANGRGGQNQAAKKFGLSVLTVSAWLKALGKRGAKGSAIAPAAKVSKTVKPVKTSKKVAKKVSSKSNKPVSELEALKAAIRALIGG